MTKKETANIWINTIGWGIAILGILIAVGGYFWTQHLDAINHRAAQIQTQIDKKVDLLASAEATMMKVRLARAKIFRKCHTDQRFTSDAEYDLLSSVQLPMLINCSVSKYTFNNSVFNSCVQFAQLEKRMQPICDNSKSLDKELYQLQVQTAALMDKSIKQDEQAIEQLY